MSHLLNDHPDWPNAMTAPTRELHGNAMEGYDPTPTPRSNREWRELAEQAQRDLAAAREELAQWREAVLNELIVAHIYTKEHDTDQKKAIQDAITWNCQVALDPAVSSDARALIAQERERAERAEARAEAAEKDAGRYRWLRVQPHADIAACWYMPVLPQDYPVDTPEQRDAAIDAAIAEGKK